MSGTVGTSFWRVAGLSYLQYVNKSAVILRAAAKEPLRSKLKPRNDVLFNVSRWENGVRGGKVDITNIREAANFAKAV